jgi:hypothetical protein
MWMRGASQGNDYKATSGGNVPAEPERTTRTKHTPIEYRKAIRILLLRVVAPSVVSALLCLIQIAIGIEIDGVSIVGRCFLPHLVSSSAQPTRHRRHTAPF